MKRSIIFGIIIYLLITGTAFSQENYELLFLRSEFDRIEQLSRKLETPEDYYWHSFILDNKGKTLNAINYLEEGRAKYHNSTEIEQLLIEFLFRTGQYTQAKPLLQKYSDESMYFLKYISILEFEGEFHTAIRQLNIKLSEDSLNLEYLTHLGDNYYKIDSIQLAVGVFEDILVINPNDQLTAYKLANSYIKLKEYKPAIEICDIALKNDSTIKKFVQTKGIASFRLKNYKEAEACFKQLLLQGDSGKFILKHLGMSEFNTTEYKKSREHLLQAYKIDSNDFEICYMLGRCFLNSPTPAKGLYYFERVESLIQPDTILLSELYNDKHSIYSTLDMYEKALECYKKAYEYNPKPEYIFFIASYYQNKLDDKKRALEYYERFIELLPPKPDSDHEIEETQIVISLRKVAEDNIKLLKEELFFEGEVP